MDVKVREAWGAARSVAELTPRITALVIELGVRRSLIRMRAGRLGVTNDLRRPWTREEKRLLAEHSGVLSAGQLARKLGRSQNSVECQMESLKLSRQVKSGYALPVLAQLLGVSREQVRHWRDEGALLGDPNGQFRQPSVERLVRLKLLHLDLRRVNQNWFRETLAGMLDQGIGEELKKDSGSERSNGRSVRHA